MAKYYLARQIMLFEWYHHIRIDCEGLFASWDKARSFLEEVEDKDCCDTDKYYKITRGQIIEFKVDDNEPWDNSKAWEFSIRGELLYTGPYSGPYEFNEKYESLYLGTYKEGQEFPKGMLVKILPQIESPQSYFVVGNYGVVIESQYEETDNEREYIIYYINEHGFLEHAHLKQSCLVPAEDELPRELCFLGLLSKHLTGPPIFSDHELRRMFVENVYLRFTPVIDFSSGKIIEPSKLCGLVE